MITIDGTFGEGGGQILRTSLAMSLVTGKPFRMEGIRARRQKPGLRQQHLTAVRAAADVGQADVQGAALGATELAFSPGEVQPGEYHFDVGTAGSTTLVLETVLPALMLARGPSKLELRGGTHNIYAPPADFLQKAFLPLVNQMGPGVEVAVGRCGFYPAGGGRLTVGIRPATALGRLDLLDRGRVVRRFACGVVCRLPLHIARREVETVKRRLSWPDECVTVQEVDSPGPGNVVTIEIQSEHVTELFTGFGQRGVPAEKVAAGAARQARRYLEAGVPVGEHLADQLLMPMALAGGGAFRTLAPTAHTTTNVHTIRRFLDVEITLQQLEPDVWQIEVIRAGEK